MPGPTPEFPYSVRQLESVAAGAQASFKRLTQLYLGLLVAAAGFALVSLEVAGAPVGPIGAAVCFVGALVTRARLSAERIQARWITARAAAETLKSEVWSFAVRGGDYGSSRPADPAARDLYMERLYATAAKIEVPLLPAATSGSDELTPWMRETRATSLSRRREYYVAHRLDQQRTWLITRAEQHLATSRRVRRLATAFETVAIVVAVAQAVGSWSIDLVGVTAAALAGIEAWVQLRRDQSVALRYQHTARSLAWLRERALDVTMESEWPTFVVEAESVLLEENQAWASAIRGET